MRVKRPLAEVYFPLKGMHCSNVCLENNKVSVYHYNLVTENKRRYWIAERDSLDREKNWAKK